MTHRFYKNPHHTDTQFLIVCDHASAHIPAEFGNAPLSADDLNRHISHDIGAEVVSMLLAERLPADVFLANVSRLVVDLNRAAECEDVIPETSDGTVLHFNKNLDEGQRATRLMRYHLPYHLALGAIIREHLEKHGDKAAIKIMGILVHSFTPCLSCTNEQRKMHIGLLWRDDEATAKKLKAWLEANTDYVIGDNEPYTAFSDASYTMRKHFGEHHLPHIAIEIRQDLISDDAGQRAMADMLARAFAALKY